MVTFAWGRYKLFLRVVSTLQDKKAYVCAYALNTGIANGKHKVVIYTPESMLFPPLAESNLLKTKHSDSKKKVHADEVCSDLYHLITNSLWSLTKENFTISHLLVA